MRREELFDAIGNISAETIEKNAPVWEICGGVLEKDMTLGRDTGVGKSGKDMSWDKATGVGASGKNTALKRENGGKAGSTAKKNSADFRWKTVGTKKGKESAVLKESDELSQMNKSSNRKDSVKRTVFMADGSWKKWAPIAVAVLLMLAVTGIMLFPKLPALENGLHKNQDSGNGTQTTEAGTANTMTGADAGSGENLPGSLVDGTAAGGELPGGAMIGQPYREVYVDIASLIDNKEAAVITDECLAITMVKVTRYTAQYEAVTVVPKEKMAGALGREVEEEEGWYRVSGHDDMQYLLHASGEDGLYTLWKFDFFQAEEYPYRDVLKIIYNWSSGEEINHIKVSPAKMDMTEEGRRIQEEIGEYEITDVEELRQFYDILFQMTCYGDSNWDKIDYGANDAGMADAVRLGRYLTIVLEDGREIDSLKYTAVSGMFYEFGGVAYNRLSAQDKQTIERILGIKSTAEIGKGEEGQFTENTSEIGTEKDHGEDDMRAGSKGTQNPVRSECYDGKDVPVEEPYREAQRYSDEVEAVQAAVTTAMMAGELPFVTESAIHEDPAGGEVTVRVTVNTKDETLLDKVRACDSTGKILKIVYSESRAVLE